MNFGCCIFICLFFWDSVFSHSSTRLTNNHAIPNFSVEQFSRSKIDKIQRLDDESTSRDKDNTYSPTEEGITVGNHKSDLEENSTTETQFMPSNKEDITEVGSRIGGGFHHFEIQSCTMIDVPVDRTGIEVKMNPMANVKKLMLTDVEFSTCAEIFNFQCLQDAKFCKVQVLSESEYIKLDQEVCHHTTSYLYLLPENFAEILEFELQVSVTGEVQCGAEEKPTSPVSDQEYCQSLPDSTQCQDAGTDVCASRCMWIRCRVNTQDHQYQTSASCVPTYSTRESLENICSQTEDYANTDKNNRWVEYKTCTESIDEGNSGISHHVGALMSLGVLCAVMLSVCLVCTCYYRYQYRKNKREIFAAPNWCPKFLFPKVSSQMEGLISVNNKNKEQEMVTDHQPLSFE